MTWLKSRNFKKCDYNFIPIKMLIHWSQGFPVFSHVILSKKCCYICHFLSESLKKTHILSKVSFKFQVKIVALTVFQILVLENAPLCNERQIETADTQCMGRFGRLKLALKMLWSNSLSVLLGKKPANEWKYFQKNKTSASLLTWHLMTTLDRIWFLQWLRQKNSKFSNVLYYHCSRVPLWYLREFLLEIKNIFSYSISVIQMWNFRRNSDIYRIILFYF